MADSFKPILTRLADGATLSEEDAEVFFTACLNGETTPAQIAAAATAMRLRGETPGEIAACARALRRAGKPFETTHDVVDTCGTGGDAAHTFNISTAAAIVAAGAGLKVAKHGGRAVSSKSGSSEVLAALGVNIEATPDQSRRALDTAGVCFLFAPAYHEAMRWVAPVRRELGFRTVFNLLGPLANPAGARRQLMGVYDVRLLDPLAKVLGALGATRAWVVHGSGLDEMTVTGPTDVVEWKDGGVRLFRITPDAVGLPQWDAYQLKGGEPRENAQALRDLLDGRKGAYRDVVLLNAAAAMLVADAVETLREGVERAATAIDDGRAQAALGALVEATNT